MNKEGKLKAVLLVVLAGIFWSFGGVLGKFVHWTALPLAGYRSLITILILGAVRKSFKPVNNLWTWVGSVGVMATGILFMIANKLTSSANAIVLQYAMTAIVILWEILILRKRARGIDIGAAIAVMGGVVLCFYQGIGAGKIGGNLVALASAFTWALVFLSGRMPGVKALDYSYQGNLLGCALLLLLPFEKTVAESAAVDWIAATAMGTALGLGYLFFSLGMRAGVSSTAAAIVSNIEPVLNPIWVFLFLGETPGIYSVLGAAVVLCTVTIYSIVNAKKQAQ